MNKKHNLPSTSSIERVALRVNDKDKVTRFYQEVIGLEVKEESTKEVALGVDDTYLLKLIEDTDAPSRKPTQTGLYHTAFLVPNKESLGAALNRIETKSTLEGAADHLVSEALYLSDPEGNGVEVYRDKPRDKWPVKEDGSIGIATKPLNLSGIRVASNDSSNASSGTTVGHIHLEVSSIKKAKRFYVDYLGMEVKQRMGPSSLFVSSGDYHHHIGLNVWGHRSDAPFGRGLEWFEIDVPSADDLEEICTRMDEIDAVIDDQSGDGLVVLNDFDGIALRVTTGK